MELNPKIPQNLPPSFEEFEELMDDLFVVFEKDKKADKSNGSEGFSYLDSVTSNRGGRIVPKDEIESLLRKSLLCGRFAQKFIGRRTSAIYYRFYRCMRWWCADCSKKHGPIHRKRLGRIMEKVGDLLTKGALRQLVFTVPDGWRWKFQSRKGVNSLVKMGEKIVKREFPGLKAVAYVHLFGDKNKATYNPHVNFHVWDEKGITLKLSPERISDIRKQWKRSLAGYGCKIEGEVNVHYSFTSDPVKIKHRIKYMCRPNPASENFKAIQKNFALLYFCMVEMRGFMFIRYFNGFKKKIAADDDVVADLLEDKEKAGEVLEFCLGETLSRTEFDLIYKPSDYDELSPGFYRIHGP